MTDALFDDMQHTLASSGPAAAIEQLCRTLREKKDYGSLFYALLLKKRYELGVLPIPTSPAQELPEEAHEPYEEAIREIGREVGQLFLAEGNIPQAWMYFRMLGEPEPVAKALDRAQPTETEDVQTLIEIAFHQGVNPRRGFDLVLERFGLCSAITMAGSQDVSLAADVREYCIRRLVRALYDELRDRLSAEIARKEGTAPERQPVRQLLVSRDWLFEDDAYHVDMSHLMAVIQMSTFLPQGEELELARELCDYGRRLSPRYRSAAEPPFEDPYRDYGVYLAILSGEDTEAGLAHFRNKVDQANPDSSGTAPAEVLVNLMLRLDRPEEALVVARRSLAGLDSRRLSCPGINELCQRTRDYRTLAEVAREQGDPVHFMAGLIAAGMELKPANGPT